MLSKLRIEKDTLETRIKNPRVNSENRNELMRGAGGPRVLGKPQETEQTRNLDNQGLVQVLFSLSSSGFFVSWLGAHSYFFFPLSPDPPADAKGGNGRSR